MRELEQVKHKPFIIFSVYQSDCDISTNCINTHDIAGKLAQLHIPFKIVRGQYKQREEDSFYCQFRNDSDKADILSIAKKFNQESILFVDERRRATLYYLKNSNKLGLGTFKQVSKFEAIQHDAYTYDIINNGYYICG